MPESFLVVWQCSKCGHTMSGFLSHGMAIGRVCKANSKKGINHYPVRIKRAGLIVPYVCGGTMEVILDERPPKIELVVAERDPPLTERQRAQELGGSSAWRKQRA